MGEIDQEARGDRVLAHYGIARVIADDVDAGLAEYAPDGSEAVARRLVVLGNSWNGHILAWDPEDDRDGEYAVYVVAEGSLSFVKAGYGVEELITSVRSADVKRVLGPGYELLEGEVRPLPLHG